VGVAPGADPVPRRGRGAALWHSPARQAG